MRRALPALLTAALALSAIAFTAETADTETDTEDLADHPCYDAETEQLAYTEEQVWFHEGDSKIGNAAAAPWDTTEPTTSVQGGAGAGALTPGTATLGDGTGANQFAAFAGTFTGCIDTILFDVYSFDPTNRSGTSATVQPANHNFGLTVTIDGQDIFNGGPLEAATTFANDGFGPNLNRFAIDVSQTMELLADFDVLELAGEHEIEVSIRSWYVNTGHAMYVWDTSEVPSGLTFNGEVTEDYAAVS